MVVVVALILLLGGETLRESLRFERTAIRSGEVWRLLSGHFVHLGWSHFLLNAGGLALVWYLVGDLFDRARWLVICAVALVTMSVGFWVFNPHLEWYVGLSGLLHGILAAGVTQGISRRRRESIVIAVLLVAKLAWEQLAGPLPGSESASGGSVVVDSHLYGAIGGVIGAFLARIRVRVVTSI